MFKDFNFNRVNDGLQYIVYKSNFSISNSDLLFDVVHKSNPNFDVREESFNLEEMLKNNFESIILTTPYLPQKTLMNNLKRFIVKNFEVDKINYFLGSTKGRDNYRINTDGVFIKGLERTKVLESFKNFRLSPNGIYVLDKKPVGLSYNPVAFLK